jgi:hypothetical protein
MPTGPRSAVRSRPTPFHRLRAVMRCPLNYRHCVSAAVQPEVPVPEYAASDRADRADDLVRRRAGRTPRRASAHPAAGSAAAKARAAVPVPGQCRYRDMRRPASHSRPPLAFQAPAMAAAARLEPPAVQDARQWAAAVQAAAVPAARPARCIPDSAGCRGRTRRAQTVRRASTPEPRPVASRARQRQAPALSRPAASRPAASRPAASRLADGIRRPIIVLGANVDHGRVPGRRRCIQPRLPSYDAVCDLARPRKLPIAKLGCLKPGKQALDVVVFIHRNCVHHPVLAQTTLRPR